MADEIGTKVSQLPLGENLADSDIMYAVEGGISKKVEVGYLKNRFVGDLTLADFGDDSTHRLVTDAEKTAWSGKQDALTFDNAPTSGSSNPVKSSGIYTALGTKANTSDLATVATTGDYDDLTDKPTIPSIEANPSGTATDTMSKLAVDGTVYDFDAGTDVIPNPSGDATATLEKVQIDSTIYDFAASKMYGEASGAIASFSDGSNNPLVKLEVDINPVQAGSGTPSPDNICPISGWSSVGVTVAGKNLYSDVFADYTKPLDYRICPIPLEIGKTYTSSAKLVGTAVSGCVIGIAKQGDRYSDFGTVTPLVNTVGNVYTNTITPDSSWTSPKLIVYAANETAFNSLFENYEIQLEVGSTATSYEAYNSDTETISLGQEVYGGELDVTDGVIRPYKYYASYNGETLVGRWMSSLDEYEEGATPTTGAQVVDFGAFDSDIIITQTTISSRNGVNNIWADCGDSDVVYIRNLNLFLNQLDARVKALENA